MDFNQAHFETEKKKHRKWPWVILAVFVIIIVIFAVYFHLAKRPMLKARSETAQMAQTYGKLRGINRFYYSNSNGVYYSVGGYNSKNQYSFAIVPKNRKSMKVVTQKNGISPDKANAIAEKNGVKKVLNQGLSTNDNQPSWVINGLNKKGDLNIITIAFRNGKVLHAVKNI